MGHETSSLQTRRSGAPHHLRNPFARRGSRRHPGVRQACRAPSRRVILNCTRQWGKSTVTAVRAVWEAYSNPGSLTLVVSRSMLQTSEFMKKAAAFVRRLGYVRRRDPDNPVPILLPNHSRIVGVPSREENAAASPPSRC